VSLLTIVQQAALRVGLVMSSAAAASSTDQNILQLVGFVNEDGQELGSRPGWQNLTRESTFATVAAEDQGSILTLAGADFSYVLNDTMWNRSQRRPVFGPKNQAQWQQLKAQFVQGPWQQYRIRGNRVLFIPAPAAGQSIYFEWITKNWCTDASGVTGRTAMTADTDVSLLDERLHVLGAIWRFKAAKKLAYAEDLDKYENAVLDAIGRDAAKPRLTIDSSGMTDVSPVVIVPAGNWGL
jgi:hypothetical protein